MRHEATVSGENQTTAFDRGDTVLVAARPKPYKARVEWVDRCHYGRPVKVKVRPLYSEDMSDRARNVRAKFILEVIARV